MVVKVITDSAADLPKATAAAHGIEVIPLNVYSEGREYQDNVTLDSKDLFQQMRQGKSFTTSLPSYGSFESAYRSVIDQGGSGVYVAFSSELSGTYQASLTAREQLVDEGSALDLSIIDSKCASTGLGLVAVRAAELAAAGASKETVEQSVAWNAAHMEHIFTVDNLEYLLRGGRVSAVSAFIGGLLNIKPILHVEAGKLVPIEKVRGRKKVFARIIEIMAERGADLPSQTIGISHGDDAEAAEELRAMIEQRFGCNKFLISLIGASIGAHAGPGTISVFFLNAKEPERT
ncbi:DegV family protein [Paenibacillus sp. TRM 82003]|nr:DegV family protein [Paenibacillus sp. TRM 82003]